MLWASHMKFRIARPSDAPILAAISLEIWLRTYIRRGVSTVFAEFALTEVTATCFPGAKRHLPGGQGLKPARGRRQSAPPCYRVSKIADTGTSAT